MSNFEVKEKKETYTFEELQETLKQQRNVVYAQAKDEFLKKELEPKLNEYQTKLKEYEIKVNEYQEKELFTNFNDKQVKLAKLLMNNEYKDFDKHSALNKIKEDYAELFNNNEIKKEIKQEEIKIFNPKIISDLDQIADINKINQLKEKAKTIGITDQRELATLISAARGDK